MVFMFTQCLFIIMFASLQIMTFEWNIRTSFWRQLKTDVGNGEKKKFDDEWKRINFPANFHFVLLQWLIHLNYKIYSSTGEIFVLPTWEFCTNLKIIIIHLLPSYKVLMDCWLKNVIISSRKIFSSHFSFFW